MCMGLSDATQNAFALEMSKQNFGEQYPINIHISETWNGFIG